MPECVWPPPPPLTSPPIQTHSHLAMIPVSHVEHFEKGEEKKKGLKNDKRKFSQREFEIRNRMTEGEKERKRERMLVKRKRE